MAESETESMDQQFCLRWNNFQKNISSQFEALRKDEDFVDVTLACGGRYLGAHKVVLSACSPYFKQLFKVNPCQHPIFFMRDVELQHVKALLEYMYTGEVNIAQTDMPLFLRTAETLQIRGLTDTNNQPDAVCDKPKSTLNAGDRLQTHPSIDNTSRDESKTPNTIDQRHRPFKNKRLDETNRFVESYYNPLTTAPGSAAKRQCPNDVREKDRHSDVLNRLNAQSPTSHTDNDINFIAGKLHTEMDIQPKVEMADYATDEESHQDDLGLMNAEAFLGLQDVKGGLSTEADCKPGTSHNLDHVPNAVEALNLLVPRRLKERDKERRLMRHSRWRSGLPQWLPITPLGVDTAIDVTSGNELLSRFVGWHESNNETGVVKIGEGVEIGLEQLRGVKWSDYRKLTRGLATVLFSPMELATCSVTGQRWSRAGTAERPVKPALDHNKVQAIISYVTRRFPMVEVSRIKQVLAYKCKENCTAFKMKAFSDQNFRIQDHH